MEQTRRYSYSGPRHDGEGRTMLERKSIDVPTLQKHRLMRSSEAWHIVNTTDPLGDSDDEVMDDHVRQDYSGYFLLP